MPEKVSILAKTKDFLREKLGLKQQHSNILIPTDIPDYTFCESVHAGSQSKWHIRKVNPETGIKYGGGIDTAGLCGYPDLGKGWDILVRINPYHLENSACAECVSVYSELIKDNT